MEGLAAGVPVLMARVRDWVRKKRNMICWSVLSSGTKIDDVS